MTENCNHGAFVSLEPAYKDRQLVLDVVEGQKVVLSRKVIFCFKLTMKVLF